MQVTAMASEPAIKTPEAMVRVVRRVDHHGVTWMISPADMFAE